MEEAYSAEHEFFLGESIVAAPVVAPMEKGALLSRVSLWVPPGGWALWHSGEIVRGPITIERAFTIDEIPMLAREG
eukprot:3976325-Pleurochrysis_carterae.AAC.1